MDDNRDLGQRRVNPKWRVRNIDVDVSEFLLAETSAIAAERGISLYGQVRDFIEEGVRRYKERKQGLRRAPLAGRQSFTNTWSPS